MSLVVKHVSNRVSPIEDFSGIIQALPDTILVVDCEDFVTYVNPAGEQFFGLGQEQIIGQKIDILTSFDSPILDLLQRVRGSGANVVNNEVKLESFRGSSRLVDIYVCFFEGHSDDVIVCIRERMVSDAMKRLTGVRNSARSVAALAAVLGHEIKNPLAGIRGAAQLLEGEVQGVSRGLAQLICEEVDRICSLVEDIEIFEDERPVEMTAINIHEVLDHVRRLVEAGAGSGKLNFEELYDPSLPMVHGNRNQLIQAFLNLLNNAVQATSQFNVGNITIGTAFRHGMRASVPGSGQWMDLPLEVSIRDDGPGVPENIRANLFDAFVTSKPGGTGLGLALVAKIIHGHGGVIECKSLSKGTEFKILLPLAKEAINY